MVIAVLTQLAMLGFYREQLYILNSFKLHKNVAVAVFTYFCRFYFVPSLFCLVPHSLSYFNVCFRPCWQSCSFHLFVDSLLCFEVDCLLFPFFFDYVLVFLLDLFLGIFFLWLSCHFLLMPSQYCRSMSSPLCRGRICIPICMALEEESMRAGLLRWWCGVACRNIRVTGPDCGRYRGHKIQ